MADVVRNRTSHSKNSRGRGKDKYKDRKKDSPRKKHRFDNGRSTKVSTPKDYDRKFENYSSPRHWEESRDNHKNVDETVYSRPQYDYYANESSLNNHATLDGQINCGDRFNNHVSGDYKFNSNDNHNGESIASLKADVVSLRKQVEFFYQENEKLRYQLQNGSFHGASNLDVNISFSDKNLERKFLPVLQELVSEVVCENITLEDLESFLSSKRILQNNIPEGELFALDNSTSEPNENEHVPRYETSFQEVLQDPDLMNEIDAKKDKPAVSRFRACFNCSEEHRLQECPYPMDYKKVAMARKQRSSQFVSQVRYHVQGEHEKDLKPGIISDKLREALGLGPDYIPSFIYHMRVLDYPPGWLEEATVESSGIALYGTDVNAADNSEANQQNMGFGVQYDPAKLIDFPGFNVPLPPNFIDESEYLGMPPLQDCHLRSVVEQYLPKVEPPKRKRKLALHEEQATKIQRLEEDMEVEDDMDLNPPLPEENPPPPPPPDDELPPPPPPPEEDSLPDSRLQEYSPESPTDDTEVFVVTEEQEFHVEEEHEVVDVADSSAEEPRKSKSSDCQSPTEEQEVFEVVDSESESGPETPMSASIMEELAPVMERYKLDNDKETAPSLEYLEELKKRLVMELGESSNDGSAATPYNNSESQENSNAASVSSLASESSKVILTTFSLENSIDVSVCSSTSETRATIRQASMTESCHEISLASRQDSSTESCSEMPSPPISSLESENGSFKTPQVFAQGCSSEEATTLRQMATPLTESCHETPLASRQDSLTESCSEMPSPQISSLGSGSFKTPQVVAQGCSSEETTTLRQMSRTASGSKLVSLGTPSLSRHSSFHKLPSYDNFSKNVTTHLNFENLPNSVGTYQKMKRVIKKVKEKINSFMQ